MEIKLSIISRPFVRVSEKSFSWNIERIPPLPSMGNWWGIGPFLSSYLVTDGDPDGVTGRIDLWKAWKAPLLCYFPAKACPQPSNLPFRPHLACTQNGKKPGLYCDEKPLSLAWDFIINFSPVSCIGACLISISVPMPYIASAASEAYPGESSTLLPVPKPQQAPEDVEKIHNPNIVTEFVPSTQILFLIYKTHLSPPLSLHFACVSMIYLLSVPIPGDSD